MEWGRHQRRLTGNPNMTAWNKSEGKSEPLARATTSSGRDNGRRMMVGGGRGYRSMSENTMVMPEQLTSSRRCSNEGTTPPRRDEEKWG